MIIKDDVNIVYAKVPREHIPPLGGGVPGTWERIPMLPRSLIPQ